MYTVDANGNKIPINTNKSVEHYMIKENYTVKKSTMKWLYWALGAVIVAILVFVIIKYLMKSNSADSSEEKVDQRFGFRFY